MEKIKSTKGNVTIELIPFFMVWFVLFVVLWYFAADGVNYEKHNYSFIFEKTNEFYGKMTLITLMKTPYQESIVRDIAVDSYSKKEYSSLKEAIDTSFKTAFNFVPCYSFYVDIDIRDKEPVIVQNQDCPNLKTVNIDPIDATISLPIIEQSIHSLKVRLVIQ